jgi:predicted amidohydrolase
VIPLPRLAEGDHICDRMDTFRIALAQLEPKLFDKEHNLVKAEKAIRQASDNGSAAIIFPELFLTGYSLGERAVELAESVDGSSAARVAGLARANRIAVLMGFAELTGDGGGAYDAVLVANAAGQILGSSHKVHLFHDERGWFVPGDRLQVIDFGLGPAGVLVCYDLEFPEAVRDVALRGAQWVATSTGSMVPNQHLQELYVQSRAAENRLWVAVANRVGREADLEFFGGSAVADPTGTLTARAAEGETVIFADVDLRRAESARLNADYLADRRPEVYGNGLR